MPKTIQLCSLQSINSVLGDILRALALLSGHRTENISDRGENTNKKD